MLRKAATKRYLKIRDCNQAGVVFTFLREVSLVICKGKTAVLKLIAATAAVRCIYSYFGRPNKSLNCADFENNYTFEKLCPPVM